MSRPISQCKLCKTNKLLCDSHVIPEFCYKPLYDEKHRAIECSLSAENKRFIQKGYREYLFCDECELLFKRLEDYFHKVWFNNPVYPNPVPIDADVIRVTGLDYAKFKLFHHSVLFRASVSNVKPFELVKLGKNQEVFRKMLLTHDPGNQEFFSLGGILLFNPSDRKVAGNLIMQPTKKRVFDCHTYTFIFGGCFWMYSASQTYSQKLFPCPFNDEGDLYLATYSLYSVPLIKHVANKIAASDNF